jgi:hypothetical protein
VIGLDQSATDYARTLCQRLDTTQQQWSRIMKVLKASGVMITCPVPQKRGRPLTEYRISAQVRYELANVAASDMLHHDEIERVLEGDLALVPAAEMDCEHDALFANLLSGEPRSRRITPANRWLIAILLAHAETPGRVTSLSYTRLEHLTGMSRNQLQSQIAKLKDLEILAHHQPGRLGHLFGSQMNSIFIFNLDHCLFEAKKSIDILLFSPSRKRQQYRSVVNGLVEATFVLARDQAHKTKTLHRECSGDQLRQDIEVVQVARALLPSSFNPTPLANRLARIYDAHSASWLLVRLQGYAEQLLSDDWGALDDEQGGLDEPLPSVIDAIASDFPVCPEPADLKGNSEQAPRVVAECGRDTESSQTDGGTDSGAPYAAHVSLIYTLANHIAVTLRNLLNMATNEHDYVCLTPVGSQDRSLLAVRGYTQRTDVEQSLYTSVVTLEVFKSNMAAWLNQHRATDEPNSPTRLPRKRSRYRLRPARSEPIESPDLPNAE